MCLSLDEDVVRARRPSVPSTSSESGALFASEPRAINVKLWIVEIYRSYERAVLVFVIFSAWFSVFAAAELENR